MLALQGSKIMFVPVAAWGPNRADSWGGELRTAAIQNGLFVVASNKGGVENTEGPRHFFGASRIISPMGEELAAAPAGEGPHILTAELDLDQVDQHGVRYTFFRDRRPELYGTLSDDVARGVSVRGGAHSRWKNTMDVGVFLGSQYAAAAGHRRAFQDLVDQTTADPRHRLRRHLAGPALPERTRRSTSRPPRCSRGSPRRPAT